MRTKKFLPFIVLLFAIKGFAQTNTAEEAIKKALKTTQEAGAKRDWTKWEKGWVHDEKVRFTNIRPGFIYAAHGWNEFKKAIEDTTNNGPRPKSFDIKNDNFNIRVNGNMAWVDFDQVSTVTDTAEHEYSYHIYSLMIKEKDDWKLASRVIVDPNTFTSSDPGDIENTLNATGYNLINGKRVDQAIEVFKVNVKLHPNSWNTYDSLGEAYALAGNKELAIENYKKSIELNPGNDSGKKALEKLMQQ